MRIIIDTDKGIFIVPNTFRKTIKKQISQEQQQEQKMEKLSKETKPKE